MQAGGGSFLGVHMYRAQAIKRRCRPRALTLSLLIRSYPSIPLSRTPHNLRTGLRVPAAAEAAAAAVDGPGLVGFEHR